MITPNLFNIFDPTTSTIFSANWNSIALPIIFIPFIFWTAPSRSQIRIFLLSNYIIKELKNNIQKRTYKNLILFFIIFWFIILNNTIGLFPYIFTATRHLIITIRIALPLWTTFILYGWINTTNHIFTHLVPLGTPMALRFFIVLIESISNIIRPITLSVRLAANIIAGHLLLSLLRKIREKNTKIIFSHFNYFNSSFNPWIRSCFNSKLCICYINFFILEWN